MLNKVTDLIYEIGQFDDQEISTFSKYFRAIAGSRLSECVDYNGFFSRCGFELTGADEQLTRELYLDCIIIMNASSGDEVSLSNERAISLARGKGLVPIGASVDEVSDWFYRVISDDTEDDLENSWGEYDDELEESDEVEDSTEEDTKDEFDEVFEDKEEEEEEKVDASTDKIMSEIRNYYSQYYQGVVNELAKRYTSLFESGYEVIKPAGILTSRGLLGLSGNQLIVKKNNIAISSMYKLLLDKMNLIEVESRSNVRIANTIYNSYCNGGRDVLYFPNKLVEYAYGRKAPSGDNQDSLNTYEPHADSSNWNAYCNTEVKKSLMSVVSGSVVRFVMSSAEDGNYFSDYMGDNLRGFLKYLERCLSTCLLMVEYKSVGSGYNEELSAFKLRVCDPCDSLGSANITDDIIRLAFMGATGDVPFSYAPRFEEEVYIKEYAHEFNHDSAQAMPLFAYKAYESLQKQGIVPTWDKMILGMFEDGTILVNGKKGVSLGANLTHQISAGSRAGKGVMTLNILVSGLLSKKILFYLDRKPDMASMLKSLSPDMFVVNGGAYNPKDDNYGTFANMDSYINPNNIPDYLCQSLNLVKSWESLGDIFYIRALVLVIGIIMARGKGYNSRAELGGDNGIMLVVDEFKNFQESFTAISKKMVSVLPASMDYYAKTIAEIRKLDDKGLDFEVASKTEQMNISYNDGSFYALSFLNALVEDVKKMNELRDASFSPLEIAKSDIFVIGQSLKHGAIDVSKFEDMLKAGRYKSVGRVGVSSGANKNDLSVESFAYSMIDFKKSDAFFGRNMEDGRSVYLAQTDPKSKACGRLDDKASNFAYLSSFTDDVRKKIVGGGVSDNISIANSCVYFKPFLVLNDAVQGDTYTEQMFARCAGPNPSDPWVSKEQIIFENPNATGDFVNYAVGFKGYLDMVGASDYAEVLRTGSDVANFVVQQCFGYPGDWLSFITDLRPQYIFTVGDVMDVIAYYFSDNKSGNAAPKFLDPMKNPIIEEFRKFNPSAFSMGGDSFEYDDSVSNYMDYELEESVRAEEMNMIFEEPESTVEESDSLYDDLFATAIEDEAEIDLFGMGSETPLNRVKDDSVEGVMNRAGTSEAEVTELLRRLNELGYPVQKPVTMSEEEYTRDGSFGNDIFESSVETEFNSEVRFTADEKSYEDLVELISKDIIKKFGGLNQITSFKVIGGAIAVNGYYYRCKLSRSAFGRLPYDIAREVESGNISRMFDYRYISRMTRLRDLEFDSLSFVYDYVSFAMGYGSRISIDLFFNDLPSLQRLCIDKKLFTRQNYMQQLQGDDVFYNPRLSTRLANFSEEWLGRFSHSSWEFTKNTMNSKKYGRVVKFLGVTAGATATAMAKTGEVGIKGGRKLFGGFKTLSNSLKNVIDEINEFK